MKRLSTSIIAGFLTTAALAVPVAVSAQIGAGFYAPPDAMDTLSAGSVGPGGGAGYVDRARGAAGAAGQYGMQYNQAAGVDMGGAPPGALGGPDENPFAMQYANYGAAEGSPFGGPAPGAFGQQPGFQPPAVVAPPTLRAWGGERIVCRRTGEVLQDARELSILATAAGNYYDDGESGNDAYAGDGIYTNITINSTEYISPESHFVKTKLIQTLQFVSPPPDFQAEAESVERGLGLDLQGVSLGGGQDLRRYLFSPRESKSLMFFQNLNPMEFAQVRIATTDPMVPLPKITELEAEQDRKIREWGEQFLRDFRVDPQKFDSEFVKAYLPPPPRAPNIPLPANFYPRSTGDQQPGQQFGGAGFGQYGGELFDGGVTGEPIGNASSRYF